jgi:hypothetical protein
MFGRNPTRRETMRDDQTQEAQPQEPAEPRELPNDPDELSDDDLDTVAGGWDGDPPPGGGG